MTNGCDYGKWTRSQVVGRQLQCLRKLFADHNGLCLQIYHHTLGSNPNCVAPNPKWPPKCQNHSSYVQRQVECLKASEQVEQLHFIDKLLNYDKLLIRCWWIMEWGRLLAIQGVCVRKCNGLGYKPCSPFGHFLKILRSRKVSGGLNHSQRRRRCFFFQNPTC